MIPDSDSHPVGHENQKKKGCVAVGFQDPKISLEPEDDEQHADGKPRLLTVPTYALR